MVKEIEYLKKIVEEFKDKRNFTIWGNLKKDRVNLLIDTISFYMYRIHNLEKELKKNIKTPIIGEFAKDMLEILEDDRRNSIRKRK